MGTVTSQDASATARLTSHFPRGQVSRVSSERIRIGGRVHNSPEQTGQGRPTNAHHSFSVNVLILSVVSSRRAWFTLYPKAGRSAPHAHTKATTPKIAYLSPLALEIWQLWPRKPGHHCERRSSRLDSFAQKVSSVENGFPRLRAKHFKSKTQPRTPRLLPWQASVRQMRKWPCQQHSRASMLGALRLCR